MKKRPGANKSPRSLIGKRRERTLELQKTGATKPEIREKLAAEGFPASTITLWRDLKTMTEDFANVNGEAFAEARKQQLSVFELMEKALLEGKASTDVVREWRSIRSEISSLLGLNAPAKSLAVVTNSAEQTGRSFDLLRHSHGLTDTQLLEVYAFMDSLPKQKPVIDSSYWPTPMEEDDEKPKQLTEGSADEPA